MEIDLELKSKELKSLVAKYETSIFLGDLSSLIQFINFDNPTSTLSGLTSPLRQLYYVAALNLTSKPSEGEPLKAQYSEAEWSQIKLLLIEIEQGYDLFFYPKEDDEIDEEWKVRRSVAMPAFLNYFNQGPLNYEEQVIERVQKYFQPFDKEISQHFGLTVNRFIEIYNFIDSLSNKFLEEKINPKEGQQSWEEFCKEMFAKKINPKEWQSHLPPHINDFFEFMYDKGKMFRFSLQTLSDNFTQEDAEVFIKCLVCSRIETGFLYYTEENILQTRPIFEIEEGVYQSMEMKQIIHAIYNLLYKYCISIPKKVESFYANRGQKLEDKIQEIFHKFFKNKAYIHRSYYTQDGSEQDLLFLIEGVAFIVEAKSSKRIEPRRDPDKAYPLILSNFEETIQKGYDQAYRVKKKFLANQVLSIYGDQALKKHIIDIKTKNYHSAFSIVVTLERFGQIQTNLSELLEIYDDDEFPWSICVDDLEIFLLMLEKKTKKVSDIVRFLRLRETLHGKIICSDELEICGAFLENKLTKQKIEENEILTFVPKLSEIFDETYQTKGLGFKDERNLDKKTSGLYVPIGNIRKLERQSKS